MSARVVNERDEDELCQEARNYLLSHQPVALSLPDPDEDVSFETLISEIGRSAAFRLQTLEIIEKVRFVGDDEAFDHEGYLWRTSPAAARWIDCVISEDVVTTPCGCSTGVRCVEAGEVFTCTSEACDCRFDRETALEVVGR